MTLSDLLEIIPWSQVSVVVALLSTYLLALLYNTLPRDPSIKHAFNILGSISLYSSLFGFAEIPQLMISPIIIYTLALKFRDRSFFPVASFAIAMFHVGFNHFYTQFLASSVVSFDATAPLMVMVIKLSSFAWCLHDGTKKDEELTDSQRVLAVREMPSVLEYFGYIFFFGGFLVGPAIEMTDYLNFTNLKGPFENIPSNTTPTLNCLAQGLSCAAIFVAFEGKINLGLTSTPEFMSYSTPARLLFVHVACIVARTKYYIAWKLSEGACNLAGIGYNGIDKKTKKPLWNRVQNIKIRGFECPENPKAITDAWNINTSKWLRNYVYFRICDPRTGKSTSLATVLTNMTSALWHGFYPGYYLFFGSASYFILVSRSARKHIRPFFLPNTSLSHFKPLYDVAGVFCTLLMCSYSMVPFVLKHYGPSIALWVKLSFCVHIAYGLFFVSLEYLGGSKVCRGLLRKISLEDKGEKVDVGKSKVE